MDRIIYLPVEIKNRDYYPRLLFACLAAERGYDVILSKDSILKNILHQLPKGLILDKSLARPKRFDIIRLLNNGFAYVSEDAETMGFYRKSGQDEFLDYRVDNLIVENSCGFFAWGQEQKDLMESRFPNIKGKVHVTGSIRADILQIPYSTVFDDEVKVIRERYGKFMLFNSHYGSVHHTQGSNFLLQQRKDLSLIKSRDSVSKWNMYLSNQENLVLAIRDQLVQLSNLMGSHSLVVRPHTVEEPRYWRYLTMNEPRIHVVNEFSVLPWILGSELLLHSGCTTAVEAMWANKKCITLPWCEFYGDGNEEVVNEVAERPIEGEYFFERVNELLSSDCTADACRHDSVKMDRFFGLPSEQLASNRILDLLDQLDWKSALNKCLGKFEGMPIEKNHAKHQIGFDLAQKKCPKLNLWELEASLCKWNKLGLFKNVIVQKELCDSTFHIRRRNLNNIHGN